MPHIIRVSVHGGVADVDETTIPAGVEVHVFDYDNLAYTQRPEDLDPDVFAAPPRSVRIQQRIVNVVTFPADLPLTPEAITRYFDEHGGYPDVDAGVWQPLGPADILPWCSLVRAEALPGPLFPQVSLRALFRVPLARGADREHRWIVPHYRSRRPSRR